MWYYIFSLLTAPGVVVHELGHAFFCWVAGIKIHKIKLFQFDKTTAGFVTHDEPHNFYQAIFISFGPLIANSLLTLFLCAKLTAPYIDWHKILYTWLAVAIGLHAIPSTGDAESLFRTSTSHLWRNPLKIIGLPFVGVLYTLNFLKRIHFDFFYVIILFWLGRFYLKG